MLPSSAVTRAAYSSSPENTFDEDLMTTAVYVYSVPVDQLRAIPSSKVRKLLATRKLTGFCDIVDQIAE